VRCRPQWSWLGERRYSWLLFLLFGPVFQKITRLTFQYFANFGERFEAYTLDVATLQQRHVDFADTDFLGEFLGADFAFREHDVEIDDDGHV
jgi:hypothetical protein